MTAPVAVTGAAGFQGRYIMEALAAAGTPTIAVVRAQDRASWLEATGAQIRLADILDGAAMELALQGASAVVHCAGVASPERRDWTENRTANVDGTLSVMSAASAAGVPRFIHFSTIGAYRVLPQHLRAGVVLSEDHPLLTEAQLRLAGAYRVSKALSERLVMERSGGLGLHWTILRSCATFGRGDPNILPMLDKHTARKLVPLPKARFPLVHAADVAQACLGALAVQEQRAWNLAGPPQRSFGEIVQAYLEVTGRKARTFWVPPALGLAFDSSAAESKLGFSNASLSAAWREALSG